MKLFVWKMDKESGNFNTETVEDDVKDGYVSLDELKAFAAHNEYILDGLKTEQDCVSAFNKLDTNGDGKLSVVEAAELLQNGIPSHIFDMMKPLANIVYSMDDDGSGTISSSEARAFLNGLGIDKKVTDEALDKRPVYKKDSINFINFMHLCVDVFIASQGK